MRIIYIRVYKKPIEVPVKQYITNSLKMNNTSFDASRNKPMAKGYDAKGNTMPYITMKDTQGAGGLTSTTADMMKYIKYQPDETNKVVRLSHTKTVETSQEIVGLNWRIDKTDTGSNGIWHTDSTFGFSSYVLFFPERKLGVVLLANESDGMTQNRLVRSPGR